MNKALFIRAISGFAVGLLMVSGLLFISKFAMGIGGSIPGYLLAFAGFNSALEVQNSKVNTVIILCAIVIPACTYLIGAAFFGLMYPLTKEKLVEMHDTLQARHAARENGV